MLSPQQAIEFKKAVMFCFDNKEFLENWQRLRRKNITDKGAMRLFIKDVRDIVWDRLPSVEGV